MQSSLPVPSSGGYFGVGAESHDNQYGESQTEAQLNLVLLFFSHVFVLTHCLLLGLLAALAFSNKGVGGAGGGRCAEGCRE